MLKEININQIKKSPSNPRYLFDKIALQDLADTIKVQGVIHPIEIDENETIICGERRWRAAKLAGLKTIPCTVKTGLTPLQKLQRQYIENAQHLDLNIVEKGRAFRNMLKFKKDELLMDRDERHKSDYHSKGIKELSEQLGETAWTIRESICLVDEEKAITQAIEKEEVPYTHIIQANKVKEPKLREKVKQKILNNDFSNRETLKDTIDLINQNPDYAKILMSKDGEDLKEAIEHIVDTDLITKQDLKKTTLMQAFPYIEEEYKKFKKSSKNLDKFIQHLKDICK